MENSFHSPQEFDAKRNVSKHQESRFDVSFSSFSSCHMTPFSKCADYYCFFKIYRVHHIFKLFWYYVIAVVFEDRGQWPYGLRCLRHSNQIRLSCSSLCTVSFKQSSPDLNLNSFLCGGNLKWDV